MRVAVLRAVVPRQVVEPCLWPAQTVHQGSDWTGQDMIANSSSRFRLDGAGHDSKQFIKVQTGRGRT